MNNQVSQAVSENAIRSTTHLLRIAIWHHAVTGNNKIADDSFLDLLRQNDVRVCLHGDVHEDRAELLGYLHPTRRIHVVVAGAFGASMPARPESTPRLYHLLQISRDLRSIRVHTRCLRKEGGAWEAWSVYPGAAQGEKRSHYDITL